MTSCNHRIPCGNATQLGTYTGEVLSQMARLVQPLVGARAAAYAEHIGPHVRHIIEHYETLAKVLKPGQPADAAAPVLDYDARERDPLVETDPHVALHRIGLLHHQLSTVNDATHVWHESAVQVHTRGGVHGEHNFCTRSSVARELMFLNSHATHHFAILQGYAKQRGESLGEGLGKAPATVAYEQQRKNELARA